MDVLELNPELRSELTLSELRDRVRSDLAQSDNVFLRDEDLDRYARSGQRLLAQESQFYQLVATQLTSGGVRDYPLPRAAVSITKVIYGDIWPLVGVTIQELFDANPLWRSFGPTMPRAYYLGGGSRLVLHPTPDATSGLVVIYSAVPDFAVGDLDTLILPQGGEEAVVSFMCWKSSLRDAGREGLKRAAAYGASWAQLLASVSAQSRNLGEEAGTVFGGGQLRRGRFGPGLTDRFWRVPLP